MATENNKNISYSSYSDLMKRKKIVKNTLDKSNLKNKISLFLTAIKTKHS